MWTPVEKYIVIYALGMIFALLQKKGEAFTPPYDILILINPVRFLEQIIQPFCQSQSSVQQLSFHSIIEFILIVERQF